MMMATLVGPIREVLRVRGMCTKVLKRSKIVLREDLRVMLQKEGKFRPKRGGVNWKDRD